MTEEPEKHTYTPEEFEKRLMEEKERVFKETVEECSRKLGMDRPPKVHFTDTPCPFSVSLGETELAHIHWDARFICVFRPKLLKCTIDDIKETAAHEVTHLIASNHSDMFYALLEKLKTTIWQPPGGTVGIEGGGASPIYNIETKKKIEERLKDIEWDLEREKDEKAQRVLDTLDRMKTAHTMRSLKIKKSKTPYFLSLPILDRPFIGQGEKMTQRKQREVKAKVRAPRAPTKLEKKDDTIAFLILLVIIILVLISWYLLPSILQ
ncbi:MAG: M48 family metallopeptidase [Euryarchaeota archaeon]|nr:M48 family metallopeptidase [Euryarchaeota archaeon]